MGHGQTFPNSCRPRIAIASRQVWGREETGRVATQGDELWMRKGIHNLAGFCCIFYGNHFLSFANHNCPTAEQTLNANTKSQCSGQPVWWFLNVCNVAVYLFNHRSKCFAWRSAALIQRLETRQQCEKNFYSYFISFGDWVICSVSYVLLVYDTLLRVLLHVCNVCNRIGSCSPRALCTICTNNVVLLPLWFSLTNQTVQMKWLLVACCHLLLAKRRCVATPNVFVCGSPPFFQWCTP